MAKSNKARTRGPEVVDPSAEPFTGEFLDVENEPVTDPRLIHEQWMAQVMNPNVTFFDALAEIPKGGWDLLSLYLYRLEPKIANREGEQKYIDCYGTPISEASVKASHGGGKFEAYLKAGKTTLRKHKFWIDGEPLYKDGQTFRGGATPGAPAGSILPPALSNEQGIASIVRQVIEATKGDSKAADAGIEVLKRAMMDGLELTSSISKRQMESTTGSAIGDKLFDQLLPKLLNPPSQPTTDPLVLKLLDAVIASNKSERREQNPTPTPAGGTELTLVKDLLGVDSLRELIEFGSKRSAETPWYVTLIANGLDKLPTLLNEFAQMQERAFQRALIAHQVSLGANPANAARPVAFASAPMIPVDRAAVPPKMPAAPASSISVSEQMIAGVVEGITRAYDEGYPGDVAGAHIRLLYPQLVDSLRPLLADEQQLSAFVAQMPPLAERSREPEWHEFQQELIEELSQVPMPAGEAAASAVPDNLAVLSPEAAGGVAADPGKKKVN